MLNNNDWREIAASKLIIDHLNDGEPNRLNFQKILNIFEFILTSAATIMFTKNGTPKTKLQLIGSIFSIIGFVRDLVRMINGEVKTTEPRRIDRRIAGKTVQAIQNGVERAKLKDGGIVYGPSANNPPGKSEFITTLSESDLKKNYPIIDDAVERSRRVNKLLSDPNSPKGAK